MQIAYKIIGLTQDLAMCTKKEKEILEEKHKMNMSLERKKIIGNNMRKKCYASVARRTDTINQDNKCRVLVEILIKLEVNERV